MYKDHKIPEDDLSFVQVLEQMRVILQEKGFEQIPQLTASHPIDVNTDFDLVPATATGTRRAVMIGKNRRIPNFLLARNILLIQILTHHISLSRLDFFLKKKTGINYVGHSQGVLSGCHNDVLNMVSARWIHHVRVFCLQNMLI